MGSAEKLNEENEMRRRKEDELKHKAIAIRGRIQKLMGVLNPEKIKPTPLGVFNREQPVDVELHKLVGKVKINSNHQGGKKNGNEMMKTRSRVLPLKVEESSLRQLYSTFVKVR